MKLEQFMRDVAIPSREKQKEENTGKKEETNHAAILSIFVIILHGNWMEASNKTAFREKVVFKFLAALVYRENLIRFEAKWISTI